MKKAICTALIFSTIALQAQDASPKILEAIPTVAIVPEAQSAPEPEEQPMQEEAPVVTASTFAVKKQESDLQNWIFAASAIVTVTAGILLASCYPGADAPKRPK